MVSYKAESAGKIAVEINAIGINILNRATAGHAGSHAQGDSVRPQHEAVVNELRTYCNCRKPLSLSRGGCH